MDADGGNKTQLTFGTHDEGGAQFLDANTLVFSSTAVEPGGADRAGSREERPDLQHLDARPEDQRAEAVHRRAVGQRLAGRAASDGAGQPRSRSSPTSRASTACTCSSARSEIAKVATADFGSPGPIVDFQAPLTHTLVADNKKKKGKFEKLFLEGRPPVNARRHQRRRRLRRHAGHVHRRARRSAVQPARGVGVAVPHDVVHAGMNLERRLQWALQGYSQTQFFYGQLEGVFYDPGPAAASSIATSPSATRTIQGGTAFGIYPFNRYRRIELFGGFSQLSASSYNDPRSAGYSDEYQQAAVRPQLFNNGNMMPLGVAFVQETTIFREFGPLAGSTMRLAYEVAPKIGSSLSRQTFDGDARKYFRARRAPACWRCAPAASRAGATTPTSPTSAATPSCAATTTCRSSARTRSSPTPSCASR